WILLVVSIVVFPHFIIIAPFKKFFSIHYTGRSYFFYEAYITIKSDTGLTSCTFFGSNQNNSVGGSGSKYSSSTRIFKNVDRLNIVGVDVCKSTVKYHSVHDIQWTVTCFQCSTTSHQKAGSRFCIVSHTHNNTGSITS